MNIEEFREFCLSLPNVTDVKGKMFCFLDINKFDKCTIKCNPIEIDELKARYNAVGMPFNSSLKYWISIQFNNDISDYEIKRLCKESHHLICLKNKSIFVYRFVIDKEYKYGNYGI